MDIHIAHILIFECGMKIYHIYDTKCVSYYDVYQNLMYPSSIKKKRKINNILTPT